MCAHIAYHIFVIYTLAHRLLPNAHCLLAFAYAHAVGRHLPMCGGRGAVGDRRGLVGAERAKHSGRGMGPAHGMGMGKYKQASWQYICLRFISI